MSASVYLNDEAFDALVETLDALIAKSSSDPVGRWEIRLALGGYGVLPASAGLGPDPADALVAALRSICAPRRSESRAA